MVLITLKKAEEPQFLYEIPAVTPISELVPRLVELYNYRLRLKRLIDATGDLIEFGVLKPENEQGYDDEQLDALANKKEESPVKEEIIVNGVKMLSNPDPTGRRCGEAPNQEVADVVKKTLTNAQACLSQENIKSNQCLTKEILDEAFNNIKGAITIAYPMGLPEWEPARTIIDNTEDLTGTAASKEVIEVNNASLWWAGKEFMLDKKLLDYTGRNDKTKIIAKIQKKGQGPPLREPTMSENQQKEMMAYYYRKQEDHKKLAANDEDDYLHSSWANPKSLKSAFSGTGDVSWRPK
ncbi:hypothetical protein DFS34DRAFT_452006 [Phlyctochytrium arcticum]|nr:hypothetical protein DFS34DRAFT_452006 [Phlyctochytrium arcticum]